jgi:hypothetical protein
MSENAQKIDFMALKLKYLNSLENNPTIGQFKLESPKNQRSEHFQKSTILNGPDN